MDVAYKNTDKFCTKLVLCMLKITNMATMRNLEVISDNFRDVGIYTFEYCGQKCNA
jgi:hypothetical protein